MASSQWGYELLGSHVIGLFSVKHFSAHWFCSLAVPWDSASIWPVQCMGFPIIHQVNTCCGWSYKAAMVIHNSWPSSLVAPPVCWLSPPPRSCDSSALYRTIDGSCNNLQHPDWGQSLRPQLRLLKPKLVGECLIKPQVSHKGWSLI